jgi:hypothetical protein
VSESVQSDVFARRVLKRVLAARSISAETHFRGRFSSFRFYMNENFASFWLTMVIAAFAGFLATLFGAIRNGFDSGGASRPRLKLWLAANFFCLGALAYGLTRYPAPLPSAAVQERATLWDR